MSKLLNQKVNCTDRPNEVGVISFYNPYNGDINIKYKNEADLYITHISKCRVVKKVN